MKLSKRLVLSTVVAASLLTLAGASHAQAADMGMSNRRYL